MASHSFFSYRLHFTSPLHIGDAKEDYSTSLVTISSDTFYSAIIACLAKLGEDIPQDGDIGCVISSLFPFYQEKKDSDPILFFPKPLNQPVPKLDDPTRAKDIKKMIWLDKACFEKVLRGDSIISGAEALDHIRGEYYVSDDSNFEKDFIVSQVSPRVVVSRDGSKDAIPFYMDRVHFKGCSGLHFVSTGDMTLLDKALSLLQHEGIGTDRNVGNGYFEYSKETIQLELVDSSDNAMSLSLYIPSAKGELQQLISGESVAYDFVRRGGWITTPPYNTLRKNVIYAFMPGSVFSYPTGGSVVLGKIVDLKPDKGISIDHSIWRSGKALFVPVKL